MDFIRARSDEQKSVRLKQITDAAVGLFDSREYDRITLAAIAKKLDFSRVNLYKYVSSKEEIYLAVTMNELDAFVRDIILAFEEIRYIGIADFALLWAKTLYRHERLLKLCSILFNIIERNVSVTCLAEFKRQLFAGIESLYPLMKRIFPDLSADQALLFLDYQLQYIAGFYPTTVLNETQKEAIRLSGIPYEAKDFVSGLSSFLIIILTGLRYANELAEMQECTRVGN